MQQNENQSNNCLKIFFLHSSILNFFNDLFDQDFCFNMIQFKSQLKFVTPFLFSFD